MRDCWCCCLFWLSFVVFILLREGVIWLRCGGLLRRWVLYVEVDCDVCVAGNSLYATGGGHINDVKYRGAEHIGLALRLLTGLKTLNLRGA